MGFSLDVSIPVFTVFLQGLLSFFSPCVLPVLPLYIGYLSGGTGVKGEDGRMYYKRSKVLTNTLCFVAGVSFAFFALGMGVSALGTFLHSNQTMFARAGGILVLLFGLYQLGFFGQSETLGKERRLPFKIDKMIMSPGTAFLMGFTFSFAWTPCVGPALAGVLLMAASASTKLAGFGLIGVYTAGFVLPFLAAGFFTTYVLELFKKHRNVVRYTVKLGGVLLIVMGLMMITGKMNSLTGYLSQFQTPLSGSEGQTEGSRQPETETAVTAKENEQSQASEGAGEETEAQENKIPALDFELEDQFGNLHKLSEKKRKTIFLNFWATWCPPCRAEMPDIQRLYEEYDTEGKDALIILGVAGPDTGNEKSREEIARFLEENGYTYPVLMDMDWSLFGGYGIQAFPTTFMIDREGNVFGYASGQLTYDMMKDIIHQTMEGRRRQ